MAARIPLFLACLCLMLFLIMFASVYGHGHGHSHDSSGAGHGHAHGGHDEPSSFKYSRQANEPRHHESHGHSHSHEDHGHAHGVHGHAHDDSHVHDDGHSHEERRHGNSHGDHDVHHHATNMYKDRGHLHEDHGHSHEDHGHSHEGHDHTHEHPEKGGTKLGPKSKKVATGLSLWATALGSTLLVSAAPVLILLFIPLDKSPSHEPRLKVLLSFASGGLLGDAFLHLIPHAISPHGPAAEGHTHSHSHGHEDVPETHSHSHDMSVGLWVLTGIVTFLAVEKLVRFLKGDGHGHSHGQPQKKEEHVDKGKSAESCSKETQDEKTGDHKSTSEKEVAEKKTDHVDSQQEDIKVAGYLNLAADFTHNFTDGLAIGASYLAGETVGIITTITILLHEVPHEVGDFAILVQSGCSKKKAMLLQLTTAVGAMVGTICSLLAEGASDLATAWILPFTAGGFIYIATVSVIPELLEDSKPWQSIKEIVALLVGIFMMVLIAEYE